MTSNDARIIVRTATEADVEYISAIGSESFSAAYAEYNEPADLSIHVREHYSPGAILREMKRSDRHYLLALSGDVPSGLCKLCKSSAPLEIPDRASLEIQQLYIHPAYQGRGIGKALVDAARDEAKSLGLKGIWLGVWERADWAIAFYTKCGFQRCGTYSFMLASSPQTDWLMWAPVR